jgi:very-short-patch-repair endonuclease
MTLEELALWRRLRGNALGWRIRRQEPIGRYIVDSVCHARRLVIEVDGDWHHWRRSDEERRLYLERLGYRVLRFSNRQVRFELEQVVRAIRAHLEDPALGRAGHLSDSDLVRSPRRGEYPTP